MFSRPVLLPHVRVFAIFFVYAFAMGGIYPRMGDLQEGMGIGKDVLGAALVGLAIGTQISLIFFGNLIERLGYRRLLKIAVPLMAFCMALASLAPNALVFFFALTLSGLCIGTIEVVINVEADRTEHRIGRRIMNRAHAFWSFGFFAAGLVGGVAKQFGVGPQLHLFIAAGLVFCCTLPLVSGFDPAPARAGAAQTRPRFVAPTFGIMVLVMFTLSAMLLEGAGAEWSVIFMRDVFGSQEFVQAMAFTAGAFAQGMMRYFADPFVERFGPLNVGRAMIATLGMGVLLVVLAPVEPAALAGFALMGIGTSGIFPLAMSAAAQRTDRQAGANVAALAQLSFVAFLIGPPALGFIGQHFGIRASFAVCIPFVIVSFFTARSLVIGPAQAARAHRA